MYKGGVGQKLTHIERTYYFNSPVLLKSENVRPSVCRTSHKSDDLSGPKRSDLCEFDCISDNKRKLSLIFTHCFTQNCYI